MEVIQTFSTLIRLIQLGESTFFKLLSVPSLEKIQRSFSFRELEQPESGGPMLRFRHGVYSADGTGKLAIVRLQIEPRKVVIEVTGTSSDAEAVYKTLIDIIIELTDVQREVFSDLLLETDESIVVAKLSIQPDALFVSEFRDSVKTVMSESGNFEFATAYPLPGIISFDIDYLPTNGTMAERRIGLTRKELSIRPKAGYDLSDQVYESKAPLSTQVHLRFLEMLESKLAES